MHHKQPQQEVGGGEGSARVCVILSFVFLSHAHAHKRARAHTHTHNLVELCELIDGFVAHKGLANKENEVRAVDFDELREGAHEGSVVLHAPRSVNKHHIKPFRLGCNKCKCKRKRGQPV